MPHGHDGAGVRCSRSPLPVGRYKHTLTHEISIMSNKSNGPRTCNDPTPQLFDLWSGDGGYIMTAPMLTLKRVLTLHPGACKRIEEEGECILFLGKSWFGITNFKTRPHSQVITQL